jgi:thiamine pyrophosphokinase
MRASRLRALRLLLVSSRQQGTSAAFVTTSLGRRRVTPMPAAMNSIDHQSSHDDNVVHIFSPLAATESIHSTLIILNTPIPSPPSPLFYFLWNRSQVRICADGGANRLHDVDPSLIPNMIVGDLDSLRNSVREYYSNINKSTQIIHDPDQDCNDLDKALQQCSKQSQVVIYGAFGGRFDQEMASMQALYKWNKQFINGLWLYNDQTCACLIGGGSNGADTASREKHMIHMKLPSNDSDDESNIPCEGPTCGLIPLAGPCESVTTEGFQWNLLNQRSEFGGLVSTSNHMTSNVVSVQSSHALVFTAEVHCRCQ